jgi:plasmid stabilization system protein ParE
MGQVLWTEPALSDLREILAFIARDSPAYASRLGNRLIEAPRRLALLPRCGARVPEFDQDNIREIVVRPYRIIYIIEGEDCSVAAVIHGSRDLARVLGQDDAGDAS